MIEIIPTVVPQSFDDIIAAKARYFAFSKNMHIDAVDGIFAPNRTWMPLSGEKLPEAASILYEAHLMIDNPLSYGVSFARAGARRIIAHVESFNNAECAQEAFDMWQKAGAKEVGVAINFDTRLEELAPYAVLCDFVHMMTIKEIGKQGSSFEESSVDRVAQIRARYPDLTISVDGGGGTKNIPILESAGATRFCIGTALAKAKDPAKEYSLLLTAGGAY